MKVFPATKIGWINLLVFPIKAYMVITLPLIYIYSNSMWGGMLLGTYGLCAFPLLLALIVQYFVCTREDTTITLIFFIPAALVVTVFITKEISHKHLLKKESWKTQTYEMNFDEVVRRVEDMERSSGGKWHWTQKQEDRPSNNILHSRLFVIREHQSGADAQSDADIVFQVSVWATETNRTKVTEQTIKFGTNRDPNLHAQDLMTETNRIFAIIKAIQALP